MSIDMDCPIFQKVNVGQLDKGSIYRPLEMIYSAESATLGYRQGILNLQITRASDKAWGTGWDGNPDCALKMLASNYASNLDGATRVGGVRALDIQARNRGTNLAWVKTVEINGRNDSGMNVTDVVVVHIRAENYGNIFTSNIALDLEMSDENTTQSQTRTALQIRNTDASAMSAVNNLMKVSHSGTNGFTNFMYCGASGDTYTAKVTAVASLGNTLGYLLVSIAGTPGRIPVFGEWA